MAALGLTSTSSSFDCPRTEPHLVSRLSSTSSIAAEPLERSSTLKRRACNECRQQKLRCELANVDHPPSITCSRCMKLGLRCQIDESFKRTRKRKRSVDLEQEIHSLKEQLLQYENSAPPVQSTISPPGEDDGTRPSVQTGTIFPTGTPLEPTEPTVSGITTRPHEHEVQAPTEPAGSHAVAPSRPRSLGNVEVSVEEADELFSSFFTNYQRFLPVLEQSRSSQAYYETSPLLFWSVISVAARRHRSNPTLHSRLAQTVPDLVWKTIRSVPHSLSLVQSLILLCTWPFPTSSSATDPTYMLAGILMHVSLQMGLNKPTLQQDFTKYRVKLSQDQVSNRYTIWTACNVVVHCVSIGVGLPTPAHLHDWASIFGSSSSISSTLPVTLRQMLQIEAFRNKVTRAFALDSSTETMTRSTNDRLPMYKLFENDIAHLESSLGPVEDPVKFHLHAARLHFRAFSLFDEPDTTGYDERSLCLYSTSCKLIEETLHMDQHGRNLLEYCPFYAYQTFVCASFVLLKVLRSDYFAGIVGIEKGRKLFNSSISALRTMSVSNNDLPGRLSDVLAYLWNHPDPRIICGPDQDGLQLRIQSRMSMSIVYDSLWLWRNQFAPRESSLNPVTEIQQSDAFEATTPGMFSFDDINVLPFDDLFFEPFFR